ncbi:MAG: arsenic metallochaperone ArsD family protein [Armatimonadetes bacterium]|nr:arsenic metallochaperone ArsD family protein [Armatimonadota bacterium]
MPEEHRIVVEIFDPPMCCPAGLCGPVVDPALLEVNEVLLRIRHQHDGRVTVERYLLPQQVGKFMESPQIMEVLRVEGAQALPMALVNGRMITRGRYPTYQELTEAIAAVR